MAFALLLFRYVKHKKIKSCQEVMFQFWCLITILSLVDGGELCLKNCTCSTFAVDCSARNLSEIPLPIEDSRADSLDLSSNQIVQVDLTFLHHYPNLKSLSLRHCGLRSVTKSANGYQAYFSLVHLDLSNNSLHIIHNHIFEGFPSLKTLNISSNAIHTVASAAFNLPSLQTLDVSHNHLEEAHLHFFETSPHLSEIDLSHNRISRLNDGLFGLLTQLSILDISHNQLMKIEDNVLVGMNISHLDLGFNSLRKIPDLPLRKLTASKTLILDGNQFTVLEPFSLHDFRVEFLSLSRNNHLTRLDQNAISAIPSLQTLTLNNNARLSYIHPGAISQVNNLVALDLSQNGLFALEGAILNHVPKLRALYLSGNRFKCHCSLAWIDKASNIVPDLDQVICTPNIIPDDAVLNQDLLIEEIPLNSMADKLSADSSGECEPYILPLFPPIESQTMGKNVSWLCKALGSNDMILRWRLTKRGNYLRNGECRDRACMEDNVLDIRYLHPEDKGKYVCEARNKYGQDQRQTFLEVKVIKYINDSLGKEIAGLENEVN